MAVAIYKSHLLPRVAEFSPISCHLDAKSISIVRLRVC